ncbi:MAG TPA: PEP-CTERM sorting domain-containing protein, partial [Candidatus Binatia bacterium]|nr:PEP-CTERM sorting domain-containing protein [Candidatus Binatia bacterium]
FRKVKFCLAIAILIAVHYAPAGASPITFSFSGTLVFVDPSLSGTFSPGQTISGTYTFESTTPDSDPGNPNFGGYPGANTNLSFVAGSYTGSFGGPAFNATNVGLSFPGPFDVYQVNIPLAGPNVGSATPFQFALDIRDLDQTALASDALPLTPPDLALFETRAITLIFDDNSFVVASLDSLQQVPEPSALFLLVVGIAAGVRSLRRRF